MRMQYFVSSLSLFLFTSLVNSELRELARFPIPAPDLDRSVQRTYEIPNDYDKAVHPFFELNQATNVTFDFHLKGIPRVDLKKQEIEVDMVLGLTWDEPRLIAKKNQSDLGFIKVYENHV